MNKRIAIVGGGPGGLTLARLLQVQGIASTVFESDAHPIERPQGGTLDLHAEDGQMALRVAGLEAEFLSVARYQDQGSRLLDKHAQVHFEEHDPAGDRPEVDRTELRRILLESLTRDSIRWGHKLRTVTPLGAAYRLEFKNGASEIFDLVVGADGTWSRVRPLLSPARPIYSGITMIDLTVSDVDASYPALSRLVGPGKMFALGDGKALIAQRNGSSVVRVYVALRIPENDFGTIDLSTPTRARLSLMAQFPGWSDELLGFIHQSDDMIVPRGLYALPVGHRWAHRPGLTLLGDAAHVMSPWGGDGVNFAMLDALRLSRAIRDDSIEDYEADMFTRVVPSAEGAARALDATISEHGLQHSLKMMRALHGVSS